MQWLRRFKPSTDTERHAPKPETAMKTLTPSQCPLCHEPNACAMEVAKATDQPVQRCWCVDAVFTPDLMERIPNNAKGMSCVCLQCVQLYAAADQKKE